MATGIKSWQIIGDKLEPVNDSLGNNDRREREDLEQWIKSFPEILGEDVAVIGEQVQTQSGPMDFLAVDSSGNTVIVELKRDRLPREALAQAIDYASDVAQWDNNRLRQVCQAFHQKPLEDYLQERFSGIALEDIAVNQSQRVLLVGFSVEESLARMVEWLSEKYNLGANIITLSYVKTSQGDEVLSRVVMIPEEVERQKVNLKKFIIEMSDEPGSFHDEDLEGLLRQYLNGRLWSAQRLRDHFIPILLENRQVTRDQMVKEFVKRKAAPDESQAGYFLSLISGQLGQKARAFLRQVIHYDYPNHPWEKDNFEIREDYRELVERIVKEPKPESRD